MVAKAKLYLQLDALEAELESRLIPHLERAASGNNRSVFCVVGFSSAAQLRSGADPVTAELVDLGAQILSLKSKLNLPSQGSIAERICWYCREWAKSQTDSSKSAKTLASQFIQEISGEGDSAQ